MLQISTSSCSRSSSYSSKDSLSADTRTAMPASVDRPLSSFDEDLQGDINYSTCQTMTTTLTEPQQLQSNESVQAARKRHAISLGTSPPQKRRSTCPLSLQGSHSSLQRSRSSSPPSPPQQFPPKPTEQSPAPLINADSGHFNSSSIFTKSEKEYRTFIDKDQEELNFPFQHSESKQQDAHICIQRTPRTETSSDSSSDLHVSNSEIQTKTTVSKSPRCADAPSPKSEINVTPRSKSSNFSSDSETQTKTETDTDTEHGVPLAPKPPGSNIAKVIVQKAVGTVEKRKGSKQSPGIDCILEIVKKQNIDYFKTLEKRLTTTDRKRILHIVAVYGSADMVECMKTWDGMEWNEECTIPEKVFGEALKGISVSKATALYLATFMDKTEIVSEFINCAGEDNIKYCFKNLQLSNPMEKVYMMNLAQLLKREHSKLEPAIIPGHRVGKDGERERVFIVYSKNITSASCKEEESLGLVMKRNPYVYTKEVHVDDYKNDITISDKDKERAQKAIAKNRDRLWRDHSNLNIIGVSPVIYRSNGADIIQKPCVVLYCSTKGVVPLDEPDFPKQLDIEEDDSIDVDVHEGYFLPGGYSSLPSTSKHGVLKMGCDIGRSTTVGNPPHFLCGTLGPFVKFNNKIGFLTCAHVLFDIANTTIPLDYKYDRTNKIEVAQPSPDTTTVNGTPQPCGHVKRAIFNPQRNPSIDAAVVELTDRIPNKGQFSNAKRSSYREAGFEELPEYNSGHVQRDLRHFGVSNTAFKFGSASDVTRGTVSVGGVDVRPLSTPLGLPLGNGTEQMINQYQVCGAYPTMTFFLQGDSGSAVFMKSPGVDDMCCIGMAIGSMHVPISPFPLAVVTPIGAVLDALGPEYNLASFP